MTQQRFTLVRALPPTVQDAVLAAVLWVLDLVIFSAVGPDMGIGELSAVMAYAAAGYLALTWRRRAPLLVFSVLLLHSVTAVLWMPGYNPVLGLLAALFTVAADRPSAIAFWVLPLALIPNAMMGVAEAKAMGLPPGEFILSLAGILFFYGIANGGTWGTGRWAYVSEQRAADLQYRREAEVREAAAEERNRIARELHDIVAHAVTVIVLQAAGARRIGATDASRVGQVLQQIEGLGQQAMGELRNMLAVLRAGESEDSEIESPRRQPDLADLKDLLDGMRGTGISVRLEIDDRLGQPAPGIGLAVYRIVQEALTNVTKHAGPGAHSTVRLRRSGDSLLVQVANSGGEPVHARRTLSTGHGLLGLHERVAAVGGHLASGTTPDGGFLVTATLPMSDRSAEVVSPGASHRDGGPFAEGEKEGPP